MPQAHDDENKQEEDCSQQGYCDQHCIMADKIEMMAKVLGVSENPLTFDTVKNQDTVIGMLVKARGDWKMVKAIGLTIIVVLIGVAVYIQTHSDKQVRETADQILALKGMVQQMAQKPGQ